MTRRRKDTYCLLWPECALCMRRRLGEHLFRPLTTAEWRIVFRKTRSLWSR